MSCTQLNFSLLLSGVLAAMLVSGACGAGAWADFPVAADAAPASLADAGHDAMPGPDHPTTFGGNRRADLLVPPSYDATRPMPLVVALHGYSNNYTYVSSVLGLTPLYK